MKGKALSQPELSIGNSDFFFKKEFEKNKTEPPKNCFPGVYQKERKSCVSEFNIFWMWRRGYHFDLYSTIHTIFYSQSTVPLEWCVSRNVSHV